MPEFRVYTLADSNRIAGPPAVITCDTDREAIEKATQLVKGKDLELWQGARCLIRIKASDAK